MKIWKVVVSAIVLAGVIWMLNPIQIAKSIRDIPLWALAISGVFVLLAVINYGIRIWVLSRSVSNARLKETLKLSATAFSLGAFSPGRIGEMVLLKTLGKEGLSLGQASAVFIADRISSLASIGAFSLLGVLIIARFRSNSLLVGIALALLIIGAGILSSKRGLAFLKKFMFKRITEKMTGFSATMQSFRKGAFVINLLLNFFNLLLRSLSVYVLLIALGQPVSLLLLTCINAMVTIAAFVPISFSGLGIREGGAVLLLGLLGLNQQLVAAAYFSSTFITFIIAAIALPFAGKPYKSAKKEG